MLCMFESLNSELLQYKQTYLICHPDIYLHLPNNETKSNSPISKREPADINIICQVFFSHQFIILQNKEN